MICYVLQHPLLHKFYEIIYISEENLGVLVQPIVQKGSLRDIIHNKPVELTKSADMVKFDYVSIEIEGVCF